MDFNKINQSFLLSQQYGEVFLETKALLVKKANLTFLFVHRM